jgi:hypothetical protein
MPGLTRGQIERAKSVGIEEYILAREPDNARRAGSAFYLIDHDSLEISNGMWNWHSRGVGGRGALDYLIKVRGLGFADAVRHLAGEGPAAEKPAIQKARPPNGPARKERPPLALPRRNGDNGRAAAYLQGRGIDRELILDCVRRGSLYESARWHNCVFVGRDSGGKARFAALRGTSGGFMRDADGSDKRFGFDIPPAAAGGRRPAGGRAASDSGAVAVFESPIDALSFQTLCPEIDVWRLSLGGTSLAALRGFLERHAGVTVVIACTDNDEAGNMAAAEMAGLPGISAMRALPPGGRKDWNEALQAAGSGAPQPARAEAPRPARGEAARPPDTKAPQPGRGEAPQPARNEAPQPDRKETGEMEDARKSIRFIDSGGKTLFTVKDGDSVRLTSGYDGEMKTLKCRHIDGTHLQLIGEHRNDYHIRELAEIMERNGSKCEPLPGQKPAIDILGAKYGEKLAGASIPMTEAALRRLVGGKYTAEPLDERCGSVILRGAAGVAVCGSENGAITSLHPYLAQKHMRELGAAEPPKKPPLLASLEKAKARAEAGARGAAGLGGRERAGGSQCL